MNGWLILALLLVAIFGLLVMARVAKPLWGFVGATLMLGAAGYAWQGSPTLAGVPRAGATQAAVNAVLGGLQGAPNSGRLWTRLGTAILAHDGGQVLSPAARTAFARGIATAPDHPGPYFYYGMALIQTGDLPGAKRAWLAALARTPRNASYREDLAMRLVLLDRLMAMRPTAPAR